jgi:predicted SAM-dependent methyltransferase
MDNLELNEIKLRGREKAGRLERTVDPIKLDLGCGTLKKNGFTGVDLSPAADLQWDINWGLPFSDCIVSEIRSEHFFEHLTPAELIGALRECRRVLVDGGILDFSVPHFDPYLEAYLKRNLNFLKEKIYDIPKGQEDFYSTCFDRIIWLLHRSGEHKCIFDRESILAKVKLAGFKNVTTRDYDPARDVNLRFSSVYVVAVK